MRSILVNFSSTYHRLVAREAIRQGGKITHIFCIPGYRDPKGSIQDPENITKDNYRLDPEFGQTKIVDLRDLQYADSATAYFAASRSCPSGAFLRTLSECESVFMRHSDRFSFYPTSAAVRRRIYHSLVCYMLDVIEDASPDAIIFADSPHVGFDTVLYYIAKALDVKTFIIEKTHLDNSSLLIEDYNDFPRIPADFLSSSSLEELMGALGETRFAGLFETGKRTRSLQTIWQKHDKMRNAEAGRTPKGEKLLRFLEKKAKGIVKGVLFRINNKSSYSRALVFNSIRAAVKLERAFSEYEFKKERLKKYYAGLADRNPDLGIPYVFFPLHMQPEKTTSAFGGVFEDQYLAIKMLSACIPDDMSIYIKEHPAQLVSRRIENMHYRDGSYYDFLAGIPKVRLVGLDVSYTDLMAHSVFNATITGSVGWESMIRGKPVIIFGNSWYSACAACFRVASKDELITAIAKITTMGKDDVTKALCRYVLFYERFFIPFAGNPRHVMEFDLPYEAQIGRYANLISGRV